MDFFFFLNDLKCLNVLAGDYEARHLKLGQKSPAAHDVIPSQFGAKHKAMQIKKSLHNKPCAHHSTAFERRMGAQ